MESLEQPPDATSAAIAAALKKQAAFELKGTMAPVAVLRLHTTDLMQIERPLRRRIMQRPQLFLNAPMLLDFGALEHPGVLALTALVSLMRSFKLVPVGAVNVPQALVGAVAAAGLGILQVAPMGKRRRSDDPADVPTPPPIPARAPVAAAPSTPPPAATPRPVAVAPPPPPRAPEPPPPAPAAAQPAPPPPPPAPVIQTRTAHGGPVVVTKPVRSGQVIYAQNNDLVVLAPVNPGAQVMADGHVHIYNTLRGRAIAGAQGLPGARIFVQKIEAELVAIADLYMTAEEIPGKLRGKPVQIYLEGRECRIAPL
jgi:septum site-determining protein MinC